GRRFQGTAIQSRSAVGLTCDSPSFRRSAARGGKRRELRIQEGSDDIHAPDGNLQEHQERKRTRAGGRVQELTDGTIVFVYVAELVVVHGPELDHPQLGDEEEK